jgi:hypothetical protein
MIATGDAALAGRLKEKRAAMADAVVQKAAKITKSTRA